MKWRHLIGGTVAVAAFLMAIGASGGCGGEPEPVGPKKLARQIESADDLIGGVEAVGRIGDYVLENDQVRFVIQSPDSATGWSLYGGALVDASLKLEGRLADDRLQEIFPQCDLRGFDPTEVEVVQGGGDGQPAILRMSGRDAGIPFLDAVIERDPLEAKITVDYILPAEGTTLEILIDVKDTRLRGSRELSCGVVMLRGDQNRIFVDGAGTNSEGASGSQPYIASANWDAPTAWALHRAEDDLQVILAQLEIVPIGQKSQKLLANGRIQERFLVTLGRDIDDTLEKMRAARPDDGTTRHEVSIQIEQDPKLRIPNGATIMGFRRRDDRDRLRAVTEARADDDNRLLAHLPDGEYEVSVELQGRLIETFEFTVNGPATLTRKVEQLGQVRVSATEAGVDGPTPVRALAVSGHDQPLGAPVAHEAYVHPPYDTFFLPVGDYTILLSRGPEYEIASQNISVAANSTTEVSAKLIQVVDSSAWISGDFHVHGTRSSDSEVPKRWRVIGAAAEGLDILTSTDHDSVTDYAPLAEALGLSDRLTTVIGTEMSPLYGHINGYPLSIEYEKYFTPRWFSYRDDGAFEGAKEPHEVVSLLRENGAQVVQANHPRDGSGVFNYLELDPSTGLSTKPLTFDAAEVLNGKRLEFYDEVRRDLAALVKAGNRVTAIGASDTHGTFSGIGYARTYIHVSDTSDLDAVWKAMREGRVVASSGPLVELTARANGEGPVAELGDTLDAPNDVELSIRVQAASWIPLSTLTIYENGEVLRTMSIDETTKDPSNPAIRFTGTVTATRTTDAFYQVDVKGPRAADIAGETVALTNPIYVDRNGDGFRVE